MRILFLNMYFPPDTSATAKVAESMVQALAESNEVTVLCGRPSYDPTERRPWKLWQTERIDVTKPFTNFTGIEAGTSARRTYTVIRVGSTDYPRMRMKLRVVNYLSYTKLSFLRGLFIPCDVILAMTDPPFAGILAAFLSMLKGKRLVYAIQDLYPDMAVAGTIVKPGLLTRCWEGLHRWTLRRAARVIVLGEDMRTRMISKGVKPGKISVVRSGVQAEGPGDERSVNREVIRAIRGRFRFVLLHAGNLGFYGAWDTLVAAMREVQNEDVALVFVGDGAERARLEGLAAGADNIRFLPFFPSHEIPSVLAAPDVHIITIRQGLEGVVVPSKLFSILAAGKPILAVAPSGTDVATLGEARGFAMQAEPFGPDATASAIRLLAASPDRVVKMGQAARVAAAQYPQAGELRRLVDLMSSLQADTSDRGEP